MCGQHAYTKTYTLRITRDDKPEGRGTDEATLLSVKHWPGTVGRGYSRSSPLPHYTVVPRFLDLRLCQA